MRNLLLATIALTALGTYPVVAQGCSMMGQGASAASSDKMMCGSPATAQDQTAAPQSAQPQQTGGCACCRNMAMMNQPGQSVPEMDMPGQQTPSGSPSTPEAPRPPS